MNIAQKIWAYIVYDIQTNIMPHFRAPDHGVQVYRPFPQREFQPYTEEEQKIYDLLNGPRSLAPESGAEDLLQSDPVSYSRTSYAKVTETKVISPITSVELNEDDFQRETEKEYAQASSTTEARSKLWLPYLGNYLSRLNERKAPSKFITVKHQNYRRPSKSGYANKGIFVSQKNTRELEYESGYEQAVMEQLESLNIVDRYETQRICFSGVLYRKNIEYWPDILTTLKNDRRVIIEVKNKQNILHDRYFLKAELCRRECRKLGWDFITVIPGMPSLDELFKMRLSKGFVEDFRSALKGKFVYQPYYNFGIEGRHVKELRVQYAIGDDEFLATCLQLNIAVRAIRGETTEYYYGQLASFQDWRKTLLG